MIYSVPFKYMCTKKTKLAYDFSYAFSSIISKYPIMYSRTKYIYDSSIFNKIINYVYNFNTNNFNSITNIIKNEYVIDFVNSLKLIDILSKNIIYNKFSKMYSITLDTYRTNYLIDNIVQAFHDYKNDTYVQTYNLITKRENDKHYSNIEKHYFGRRKDQIHNAYVSKNFHLYENKEIYYENYIIQGKTNIYNAICNKHINAKTDILSINNQKYYFAYNENFTKYVYVDKYRNASVYDNNIAINSTITVYPNIDNYANTIKHSLLKTDNKDIFYYRANILLNGDALKYLYSDKYKLFYKDHHHINKTYTSIMFYKNDTNLHTNNYIKEITRYNQSGISILYSGLLSTPSLKEQNYIKSQYSFITGSKNIISNISDIKSFTKLILDIYKDEYNSFFVKVYNNLFINKNYDRHVITIPKYMSIYNNTLQGNKIYSNVSIKQYNKYITLNNKNISLYKNNYTFVKDNKDIYKECNNIFISLYSKNISKLDKYLLSTKDSKVLDYNKQSYFIKKKYHNMALFNKLSMSEKLFYNVDTYNDNVYKIPFIDKETDNINYLSIYITSGIKQKVKFFAIENAFLLKNLNDFISQRILPMAEKQDKTSIIYKTEQILRTYYSINNSSFVVFPISKIKYRLSEEDNVIAFLKDKCKVMFFDDAIDSKIHIFKKSNDLEIPDETIKYKKINNLEIPEELIKYKKINNLNIYNDVQFDKNIGAFIDYYSEMAAKLYLHGLITKDNPYEKESHCRTDNIFHIIKDKYDISIQMNYINIYKANNDFTTFINIIKYEHDNNIKNMLLFDDISPYQIKNDKEYRLINDIIWHNTSTQLHYYSHTFVKIDDKEYNSNILKLTESFILKDKQTFINDVFKTFNIEHINTLSVFSDGIIFDRLKDVSYNYDFVFYDNNNTRNIAYSKYDINAESVKSISEYNTVSGEIQYNTLSINNDITTGTHSNYNLYYEDNNAEHWAWVYEEEDFNFAFGVDELLLPENDIRYENFEDLIWDREHNQPRDPVEIIDENTFIARLPHRYPFIDENGNNKYEDIARQYYGVKIENYFGIKTTVMRTVFINYYKIWQNNVFNFAKMTQTQAMAKMLDMLYSWIIEYFSEEDLPHALRVFRQIRWYGESALLNDSQYVITYEPDDLTSGALDSDTMDIPSSLGAYSTMYINKKLHVIAADPAFIGYDVFLEMYIDNTKDTVFSFSLATFTPVEVYVNNVLIDTITRNGVKYMYNLPYTGETNTIKILKRAENNSDNNVFYIGNIIIKDCGINGKLNIDFDNSQLIGNKILNTIAQKAISYANLIDECGAVSIWDKLGQGNMAVSEAYDKIKEYWEIHWNQQYKGKRLTIKRT